MKILEITSVKYVDSDSKEIQGKRKEIEKYLNHGYYIKEERNGYFVLVQPVKILADIATSDDTIERWNIKHAVLDYYGKSRISYSLFKRFYKELKEGKVVLTESENGTIYLQSLQNRKKSHPMIS